MECSLVDGSMRYAEQGEQLRVKQERGVRSQCWEASGGVGPCGAGQTSIEVEHLEMKTQKRH